MELVFVIPIRDAGPTAPPMTGRFDVRGRTLCDTMRAPYGIGRSVPSYAIRAELASRHDPSDVEVELRTLHGPRITELQLAAVATLPGQVVVTMTVESEDLWIAMLTCMAILDHNSYEVKSWAAHQTSDS